MDPITVMRIETDDFFHPIHCKDGESRKHFYEITDQGTIVQYLAAVEDTKEEFIIEKNKTLDNGLEAPFVFSLVEARGVGSFTYTPQVSVGANAALGAALGGTAGAVIGAATAAQANANAASFDIPVTFSTGLSYLKFNGERIENIQLYPSSELKTHFPLLYKSAHKCFNRLSVRDPVYEKLRGAFFDEWIEAKFGKARGFYGKYRLNFYNESTTGDTLAKRIEFYTRFVAYYCSHRGEIGALDEYVSDKKTIESQKLVDDVKSKKGAKEREIVFQNLRLIIDRARWREEQDKKIYKEHVSEMKTLKASFLQRKKELDNRARELSEEKQLLENELSSLGLFQLKAKKKTQEALDACEREHKDVVQTIDEETNDFTKKWETINKNSDLGKNKLISAAERQFPKIPYGNECVDAAFLDGLINTCPKKIAEQGETGARLTQLLYLILIDGQMLTTKDVNDTIKTVYNAIWNEEMLPDYNTSALLKEWLNAFCNNYSNMLSCIDERKYLEDYLWKAIRKT